MMRWYPTNPGQEIASMAMECEECGRDMKPFPCPDGSEVVTFYCFCGAEAEVE